jgi:hypothetical protein
MISTKSQGRLAVVELVHQDLAHVGQPNFGRVE